ncbi:hypothetical protein ACJX0J_012563 [Zea mays]
MYFSVPNPSLTFDGLPYGYNIPKTSELSEASFLTPRISSDVIYSLSLSIYGKNYTHAMIFKSFLLKIINSYIDKETTPFLSWFTTCETFNYSNFFSQILSEGATILSERKRNTKFSKFTIYSFNISLFRRQIFIDLNMMIHHHEVFLFSIA